MWYVRKNSNEIEAVRLEKPKILISRSGIFWGKRGDWLLASKSHKWIVEASMFERLYEPEISS